MWKRVPVLLALALLGCASSASFTDVRAIRPPQRSSDPISDTLLPDSMSVPVDAVILVDGSRLGGGSRKLLLEQRDGRVIVGGSGIEGRVGRVGSSRKYRAPWTDVLYVVHGSSVREYKGGQQSMVTHRKTERKLDPALTVMGVAGMVTSGYFYRNYRDLDEQLEYWGRLPGRRRIEDRRMVAGIEAGILGALGVTGVISGMIGTQYTVLPNGWRISALVSPDRAQPQLVASYGW